MTIIAYAQEQDLTAGDYIAVLSRSALGRRRPLADIARIETMLRHSSLIVTARDGERIVGVARCLSDFAWVTYLSDLAVDDAYQGRGIGRTLIEKVREIGGDGAGIGLFSVADAIPFYEKLGDTIGMEREPKGFWLPRKVGA